MEFITLLEKISQVHSFESQTNETVTRQFNYVGSYRGYIVELNGCSFEQHIGVGVVQITIKSSTTLYPLCEVKFVLRKTSSGEFFNSVYTSKGLGTWYTDVNGEYLRGVKPEEIFLTIQSGTGILYIEPLLEALFKFMSAPLTRKEEKVRR